MAIWGWAGLCMRESPQMLTVPRSGRPGRDTMMQSWSSGRLGKRSREFSQWSLCKERGWRGGSFSSYILLLFFIYFFILLFYLLLLIFSYHKSSGRASPHTSHSRESWKLRQRPPGSEVQVVSPFPSAFQLLSFMG